MTASISSSDSIFKQLMPTDKAYSISASVLPTPEKTTFLGSPPAAITRRNSPSDTISKPAPNLANKFNTAKFEQDLTAKQVKCFFEANAFSKAFKCLSMVAFE